MCTVSGTVTINDAGGPTIDNVTATDVTCGQNNGAVEVSFTGGTAPYSLTVNGVTVTGNSPLTVTGLPMGNYPVEVEDANMCSDTDNVTINDSGAPTIDNVTSTDATCGSADGQAVVTISGGTAPYDVEINGITVNGNSPVTVTGLAAGTYPVNVMDANSCTATGTVTISDAGGPMITNINPTDATCGEANGEAVVMITGGTPGFTVTIDGQVVTNASPVTVTGLSVGTHVVNVTDAAGCSTSGTVTIGNVAGPTINNVVAGDTNCGMTNGSLTINITGGTAPITYDLNSGAFTQTDDNVFSNLDDGSYSILVTDANGCTATTTATIADLPGVAINSVNVTDANCGLMDGAVTINVSGGPAPVTYDLNGVVQIDNGTFNGLAAGTYPLIVTDANNCTATQNVVIGDAAGVVLDDITIVDATCGDRNGSVTLLVTGGTAPITYTLNGVDQVDDNVFIDLEEGSYPVMITDDNGCTAMGTAVVGGSEAPVIDNIMTVDANCNQADGSATINVTGGTPPYTYDLAGTVQNDPNNTFMMLASGNYTLIVTDANGCTVMGTVNITDADGPVIDNVSTMNATCGMASGELAVTISGGQPPYDVLVDGVTQTSPNNTFTSLLPGNYPVQVTDANGCVSTTTATIDNTPGVMITDITTVDATCGQANGSKTVIVSGGNAPYTFECNGVQQIDNGLFENLTAGTYTVVVTDADGCTDTQDVTIGDTDGPMIDNVAVGDANCDMPNGTLTINASQGLPPYAYTVAGNTQVSNVFNGLLPGVYDPIIVEDANGCVVTTTATVGNTPGVMITDITTTDATCGQADGSKTITVSGGTAPYTFECNGVQQIDNGTFTDLSSGSYAVMVTDANGCTATGTANISDAGGPSIDSAVATDATCGTANGTITVMVSGIAPPYNVTVNGVTLQTAGTVVFDNLPAGIYGIEVEDNNGCVASSSVEVIGALGVVLEEVLIVDASCGQADGSKEIIVSGGTSPYIFECNGVVQVDNGLFQNLGAGVYPFTVTDANGCMIDGSATINDMNGPSIDNITVVDATNGNMDGSITVSASSGTPPYTFAVDGTDITDPSMATFTGLGAGTYPIVVTDANGCTATAEAIVNEGGCPTITDIVAANSVCGGSTGTITVTATGGEAPLMYALDGNAPQASNEFTNVMAGVYTVTVTDNAGCAVSQMITVEEDGAPMITDIAVTAATCGENNGMAVITATGGTSPYTYDITGIPQNEDTFSDLQAGTYTVTVADVNGCSAMQMFTIDDLAAPVVDDVMVMNATCGSADGMVTIEASGGNGTLLYSFDGGAFTTNNVFTNVAASGYDYAVMDDNCTITGIVAVSNEGAPTIASIEITDASCGTADGALVINVMGGTPPLNYEVNGMVQIDNGTFNNLPAGDYTIVVTDANDCVAADVATINEVGSLTVAILGETTICVGDFATLTADPLDQGYSFLWSTGATTDQIVVPSDIGTVTLTATLGGCTGTTSVDITAVPQPVANAGADVNMGCDLPSVTLDGSNSTGSNLQYSWTTPDGNIVGASNTPMIEVGAGGMYILEVTESLADCVGLDTVMVEQGVAPVASAGPDMELTCLIQAVTLDGSGSDQGVDMMYTWTGPGITASNSNQNSPQVTMAGEYVIEVENTLNNCTTTDTVLVTENQAFPLAEIELVIPIDCNNLTIDIDGSNSSSGPNIAYQWLDSDMNPISGATSNTLTVNTEGTYFLQVTDTENGCVSTASQVVDDITAYPLPSPNVSGILTCTDMEVDLDGTGSSIGQNITYEWFFNGNSFGTGLIVPTDIPGDYTLVVTDTGNDCTNDATITVIQNIQPPTADAGSDTELDCLDPVVSLDGSGSTQGGTISYQWSGDNSQPINNPTTLSPGISQVGTYSILVTNSDNGCTATDEVVVLENTEIADAVDLQFETPTCQGDSNGAIIVSNVIGGQGPFLYSLDGETFGSSSIFNNLAAGSYELSVQSANGCTYSEAIVLADGNDLEVDLGENIFINIGETASFTANVNINPFAIDTFLWSTSDTLCFTCLDQVVAPLSTSSYSIEVIDENGCVASDDLTVIVNENLDVYIPNVFSPNGDGANDMFFIQAQEGVVVEIKTFKIFNRWGATVFENSGFMPNIPQEGWNGVFKGDLMNPQVFVFMAEVEFINGNVEMISGDITLMR
ncbi:MAG: gliding motility-associated C-terminal domain-containing protein [Lewinella sp.]|uniref:T9SS type B sorting domain-containing protein n=1 Tax=Lewinella sp. TaxID=2004506 RepID=UPI003D6B7268